MRNGCVQTVCSTCISNAQLLHPTHSSDFYYVLHGDKHPTYPLRSVIIPHSVLSFSTYIITQLTDIKSSLYSLSTWLITTTTTFININTINIERG